MKYFILVTILFALLNCTEQKKIKILQEGEMKYKVQYYSNGQVKSKVPLKDGIPFGIEPRYREDGTLYQEIAWYDGEIYSHQFEYYDKSDTINQIQPSGDTLLVIRSRPKRYWYINEKGKEVFSANYNYSSELTSYKGKSTVEYKFKKGSLDGRDSVEIRLFYPILDDIVSFDSKLIVFTDADKVVNEVPLKYNYDLSISDVSLSLPADTTLHIGVVNNWKFSQISFSDTSYLHSMKAKLLKGI